MTHSDAGHSELPAELTREYTGNGIVVEWYASRCIHSGNCVRALRHVFNPRHRPWINATADTADRIAHAVEGCPSGALQYRRTDE
ncbi:MAG TPA: (4Fe-4S)-binding protein [Gemmatimonadaceae bacterium]|nr:(4Fe-4S)-binding protein [Gemmatimonadaceae bacterium]